MRRPSTNIISLLCLCGVLSVGGCIGPMDTSVSMPAMRIEGRVADKDGKALTGQEFEIVVPLGYCSRSSAFEYASDPSSHSVMTATESTGSDGAFVHQFPRWTRLEARAMILVYSTPVIRGFPVIVKDKAKGDTYVLQIERRKVHVYALSGPADNRYDFTKSDEVKTASAMVEKKANKMTVRLTLVRE